MSTSSLEEAIDRLGHAIRTVPSRLSRISEEESRRRPTPDRWATKEVIGHLIDSVANNHQRFVRGQLQDHTEFPEYQQESWVRLQDYQEADWPTLIDLWRSYNAHLLHIVTRMTDDKAAHLIRIGDKEWVSLAGLFVDYVEHLEHHLRKLFGDWDTAG